MIFQQKNSRFSGIRNKFCTFLVPFERINLLRFESQLVRRQQNIFGFRSNENARYFAFAISRCCQNKNKKTCTQADRGFRNNTVLQTVAIVDIDAFKM